MAISKEETKFWHSFIQAVEAQPREASSLRGRSGLAHPIVALGIDESRHRVVIVSGEPDARSAVMAYADIQAALPSEKVVMARPAPVNLALVATMLSEVIGKTSFSTEELKWFGQNSADA